MLTLLTSLLANIGTQFYQDEFTALGGSFSRIRPPARRSASPEEGHKGGQVTVGPFGGGKDDDYSRTLVDLVDVNGDGLPDQIMKLPGQPFRIKLNTGSGFGTEFTSDAIAWPNSAVLFLDPTKGYVPVSSADTLGFERGTVSDDSNNYVVYGDSYGNGSRQTVIEFADIDGDGRLDQVMKNADIDVETDGNAQVWARLNQVGASNLLSGVTLPLGGKLPNLLQPPGKFRRHLPAPLGRERQGRHAGSALDDVPVLPRMTDEAT